tara:strand:+ start:286 stop:969 length:684 start_codon:yes stop_codon:yes gene_type:complete
MFNKDEGAIRAAVLAVNDGLVSNFSLVMGVAGSTVSSEIVTIAGFTGLLAGAFSMAAGEYISMRSQREIYENQISKVRQNILSSAAEGKSYLAKFYVDKGVPLVEADRLSGHMMRNRDYVLETIVLDKLGLSRGQLGSPYKAALSSFFSFVAGAIVPLLPYIIGLGSQSFITSLVLSAIALILVGGIVALVSGRSMIIGSIRMLLIGSAAAAVTFGIGRLIGVELIG